MWDAVGRPPKVVNGQIRYDYFVKLLFPASVVNKNKIHIGCNIGFKLYILKGITLNYIIMDHYC